MIIFIVLFVVLVLILMGVRIAQEYERSVVFRLGRYHAIKEPGIYLIIKFINKLVKIDSTTKTVDLAQQETITKDSVTTKVNVML